MTARMRQVAPPVTPATNHTNRMYLHPAPSGPVHCSWRYPPGIVVPLEGDGLRPAVQPLVGAGQQLARRWGGCARPDLHDPAQYVPRCVSPPQPRRTLVAIRTNMLTREPEMAELVHVPGKVSTNTLPVWKVQLLLK
jgi:hypothetical protein